MRDPAMYAIRPEFKPQPGDVVITKQRASAFFGTPLTRISTSSASAASSCAARARQAACAPRRWMPIRTAIMSRWWRNAASTAAISHKINLFDMHHKYCDVMHIDEVVRHLDGMAVRKAG